MPSEPKDEQPEPGELASKKEEFNENIKDLIFDKLYDSQKELAILKNKITGLEIINNNLKTQRLHISAIVLGIIENRKINLNYNHKLKLITTLASIIQKNPSDDDECIWNRMFNVENTIQTVEDIRKAFENRDEDDFDYNN